jgi:hypothetical protein
MKLNIRNRGIGRGLLIVVTTVAGAALWVAAEPQRVRYTYDAADRLVRVLYDKEAVIRYDYDASGNRTRKTVIGPGNPNADYDGNSLADLWEYIYFGFTGVVANADADADGFVNWQEARCWTDPTNALSHLQVAGLDAGFDASNGWVVIRWPSERYATYRIHKTTNLNDAVPWPVLANSLPGTPPQNVYTDMVGQASAVFYRIGAQ